MLRAKLTAALGVMALSGAFSARHSDGRSPSPRRPKTETMAGAGRLPPLLSGPTAKGFAAPTTTMRSATGESSVRSRTTDTTALPAFISASAPGRGRFWKTPTDSERTPHAIDYYAASGNPLSGAVAFELGPMSAITERARAKINLTLRVLGRRADGYHLLESLIVFAGVGDGVTFEPGGRAAVEMSGPYASAIAGEQSCRRRRSQSLAAADPILTLGRVTVEKQLPIAAGIGGGSADAAAVLRAVRRINPANGVDWEQAGRRARRRRVGVPRRSERPSCGASASTSSRSRRCRASMPCSPARKAPPRSARPSRCLRGCPCQSRNGREAARSAPGVPRCCGAHRLYARRRQ